MAAGKQKVKKSAMSVIAACTCVHAFQDAAHGRGRRVFNPSGKVDKIRCTVCSKLVDVAQKQSAAAA